MSMSTRLGEARQFGRGRGAGASFLTSAGRVTLAGGTTFSHIKALAQLPGTRRLKQKIRARTNLPGTCVLAQRSPNTREKKMAA